MLRTSFIFLLSFPSVFAQQNDSGIIELRATISKIVDVQVIESKERLAWETRRQELGKLLQLHRQELVFLDEELGEAGNSAPAHAEAIAEIKVEIEALKQARRLTSEAVARNIPRIMHLAKSLPEPLTKELETELATLNSWQPSDEPRAALRSIIALLGKAEQFNRRFTRTTEVREGQEVGVLYLGLAQAFYAGRKDKAGIGQPGPDGWTWKVQPEIHSELINTFEILDQKQPPSMVTLPLEIR